MDIRIKNQEKYKNIKERLRFGSVSLNKTTRKLWKGWGTYLDFLLNLYSFINPVFFKNDNDNFSVSIDLAGSHNGMKSSTTCSLQEILQIQYCFTLWAKTVLVSLNLSIKHFFQLDFFTSLFQISLGSHQRIWHEKDF